ALSTKNSCNCGTIASNRSHWLRYSVTGQRPMPYTLTAPFADTRIDSPLATTLFAFALSLEFSAVSEATHASSCSRLMPSVVVCISRLLVLRAHCPVDPRMIGALCGGCVAQSWRQCGECVYSRFVRSQLRDDALHHSIVHCDKPPPPPKTRGRMRGS